MKRLFTLILLIYGMSIYAQEKKPDCKPKACTIKDKKACKPGETKTGEAKVITELRGEIQFLKAVYSMDQFVRVGETDEESLEILINEMESIASTTGVEFLQPEGSKAEKVAAMRRFVSEIKKK